MLAVKRENEPEVVTCRWHARYRGLRIPRNGCEHCMAIYNYRRHTGVRETRTKRKTYDEIVKENL